MVHNKVMKAFERVGNFLEEKRGKKKVCKAKIHKAGVRKAKEPPKPISAKSLAYKARTAHNKRRKEVHCAVNFKPDRDGLPVDSGRQLLRYMSNKSFKGKPRLRDLDEHARAYFAKLLERDMGAGYKRELARLEALERDEGEEKAFQEQELMTVEEGLQELEIKGDVEETTGEEEENIEGLWEGVVVTHLTRKD